MNYTRQRGIIYDPENKDATKVPEMPLLIILDNGIIGEASSIRGALALIIGNDYLDAEDGVDEWHLRVEAARKESMKAIIRDANAVVYELSMMSMIQGKE